MSEDNGNNVLSGDGKRDIVFPYDYFRAGQRENIGTISDFIGQRGKKVLIFRGSTGIGKTPLAMASGLHTIFDERNIKTGRIFYVSTTKSLQEQARKIADSFAAANPELKIVVKQLRGRNNYACIKEADKTADSCISSRSAPCIYKPRNAQEGMPSSGKCVICKNGTVKISQGEMCEYYGTKFEIIPRKLDNLEIVVMTTQYLIAESLFAEEINPADLIIFDEGRHLESQLVNATALEIDDGTLNYIFGYDYPINCNVQNFAEVKMFLKELVFLLGTRAEELEAEFRMVTTKKQTFIVMRKKEIVARMIETIRYLERNWSDGNIVIDKYKMYKYKRENECLRLRFVDVSKPFKKLYDEMITNDGALCLMSATMQSEEYIQKTFSIADKMLYFNANSGWDKALRPVILMKGLRLNSKVIEEKKYDIANIIKEMVEIASSYNKNILVHTHNNKLRNFLVDYFMNDERIISHDLPQMGHPFTAQEAFNTFCNSRGKVLISASMGEGLDFKGEICEVQVIVKIPYPNMIDVWVKRKSELDSSYMSQEAVLALEQMIGRVHRTETDFGLTIILDSAFLFLAQKSVKLDSEAWDNLIGYRKSERIESKQVVDFVRKVCEFGRDGMKTVVVDNPVRKEVGNKTNVACGSFLKSFSKIRTE